MRVEFHRVDWPFASAFRIAYQAWTHAESVMLELRDGKLVGRGEALGVFYRGETVDSMLAQLADVKCDLVNGLSRDELQTRLGPGGARNAIDCALWDLEAKRSGRRAWDLAGVESVAPLITAYTLSMDAPAAMARQASALGKYTMLKLKLAGDHDIERVSAVRAARQDVDIIVDANQSWNERQLFELPPRLSELGVQLIEQPLPVGKDGPLAKYQSPVPFCADESCQSAASLPSLVGKYQYVNIKLDKTGGLTEALRLAHAARLEGMGLMVGCMAGSSLSMAPAFIVGQLCSFVDLDGPLLSASDTANGIRYDGSRMFPPEPSLWG